MQYASRTRKRLLPARRRTVPQVPDTANSIIERAGCLRTARVPLRFDCAAGRGDVTKGSRCPAAGQALRASCPGNIAGARRTVLPRTGWRQRAGLAESDAVPEPPAFEHNDGRSRRTSNQVLLTVRAPKRAPSTSRSVSPRTMRSSAPSMAIRSARRPRRDQRPGCHETRSDTGPGVRVERVMHRGRRRFVPPRCVRFRGGAIVGGTRYGRTVPPHTSARRSSGPRSRRDTPRAPVRRRTTALRTPSAVPPPPPGAPTATWSAVRADRAGSACGRRRRTLPRVPSEVATP